MSIWLLCLTVVLLLHKCDAAIPPALLMNAFPLSQPDTLCNDGSVPQYFYRNCSANWDRKPGDPDFCQKGTIDGVAQRVWFISFLQSDIFDAQYPFDNAGWCVNQSDCSERSLNLTGSDAWPSTFLPAGLLSAFPEQNPNFYKASSVVVPYCSSDAWMGDSDTGSWHFHGSRIVRAVMRDLFDSKQLDTADSIVIIGGPGVMTQVADMLPLFASSQRVYLMCDGCLLMDVSHIYPPVQSSLLLALQQGWSTWKASISPSCPCSSGSECLTADALVEALRLLTNAGSIAGVLFNQPLLDRVQLAAIGAWPFTNQTHSIRSAFASAAVTRLRKISDSRSQWRQAPFVLGAACFSPTSCALSSECTFSTMVGTAPCDTSATVDTSSLAQAASVMINDRARPASQSIDIVDKTFFVGANPTCAVKPLL